MKRKMKRSIVYVFFILVAISIAGISSIILPIVAGQMTELIDWIIEQCMWIQHMIELKFLAGIIVGICIEKIIQALMAEKRKEETS